ncbi:peptide chain release factor N(5)-glutamine methyltransferase [Sandaracinobacteroides hominis]|uniref:peptide chain release factor N(5)-glutamine methyltransferase n=1 Tax=Sandaracinobacteroides hominis TaxID=2780086 RepID=UPI001F3D4CBB|nr:peptide chain release factor N(5)-glutamine methyltransferase [Sandaracinobacteroides hominis]
MRDRHALLRGAAETLPGDTPRLDAELLLAHVLGEERLAVLASREAVSETDAVRFERLLARRRTHEPVAHILGEREFWSLPFRVNRDVLVPRPDSETLVAEALAHFRGRPPERVLDLGTGSGALLLAVLSEWPEARGLGIDLSEAALAVARDNAARLELADRATFRAGDWVEGVEGRFDLILCNPPYIEAGAELMPDVALFEPASALFGGVDGLDPYRLLFPRMAGLLAPGGVAIFEFGVGQEVALGALAAEAGLASRLANDLSGRPRAILLRDGMH